MTRGFFLVPSTAGTKEVSVHVQLCIHRESGSENSSIEYVLGSERFLAILNQGLFNPRIMPERVTRTYHILYNYITNPTLKTGRRPQCTTHIATFRQQGPSPGSTTQASEGTKYTSTVLRRMAYLAPQCLHELQQVYKLVSWKCDGPFHESPRFATSENVVPQNFCMHSTGSHLAVTSRQQN